mmetsp:Transcript_84766/g.165886  ORF Transcript_84766/g.165886 Transcript_84766/m.165886 type:complete len:210 (+) Transcript_84766:140-769(+)
MGRQDLDVTSAVLDAHTPPRAAHTWAKPASAPSLGSADGRLELLQFCLKRRLPIKADPLDPGLLRAPTLADKQLDRLHMLELHRTQQDGRAAQGVLGIQHELLCRLLCLHLVQLQLRPFQENLDALWRSLLLGALDFYAAKLDRVDKPYLDEQLRSRMRSEKLVAIGEGVGHRIRLVLVQALDGVEVDQFIERTTKRRHGRLGVCEGRT